jgi:hypothetical protein
MMMMMPRLQSRQINYVVPVSTTGSGALMFYLSTIKGKRVESRRVYVCTCILLAVILRKNPPEQSARATLAGPDDIFFFADIHYEYA